MNDIKHTAACIEGRAKSDKERAEWAAAHPDYCRHCEGWGGFWSSYDPSPAGVSLSPGSMMDFAECQECYGEDKCPWCGNRIMEVVHGYESTWHCTMCAWTDNDNAEGLVGMPPQYECYCWEEEYYKDLDKQRNEAYRCVQEEFGINL